MKTISQEFKDYLAGEAHTLCTCWKVERTDGKVFCFTNLDIDLTVEGLVYKASNSYEASNMKSSSQFSVDNMELTTFLKRKNLVVSDFVDAALISVEDIAKGIWDRAKITIFIVNYTNLSMGKIILRTYEIGEIKTTRNTVVIEGRSKKQKLNQMYGRTYVPNCDAKLGDARCKVDLAPFTFTGTVDTVISQHAWIDTSLTQTNSGKTVNIQNVQAGSTTYFQSNNHGLSSGDLMKFGGIKGSMSGLNGKTFPINYINANNFSIAFDSSYMLTEVKDSQNNSTYQNTSYSNNKNPIYNGSTWNTQGGNYIGAGSASSAVESEYFQSGVVTWLTGENAGLSVEVSNYSPQYVFISERAIGKIKTGDTYKIVAGCNGTSSVCSKIFNNIINFRGFPLIPGTDAFLGGN